MSAWSKTGGVAAKVGFSRKFNAHNRLIEFHSRTAANLHPGCEDSFAMLFHNSENVPFEQAEHRRSLKEWGLAPDPKADNDDSEDDGSTTEMEEEDTTPPPGKGSLSHAADPNKHTLTADPTPALKRNISPTGAHLVHKHPSA